ncbi:IS630 family transposase [filamentous cyanobacterium LEGE 11480]|uniref:IS630 family transposase n=1 Tax=Romeriopsis navalis LEGE 11480 TaxID=2777977 RepID=A0A928VP32_9CYAN|nr:IS630 family transposase [Romeriopsis navalis]MBE9031223.1 IS630 family transposase [Romeriopsis navalis LEGE 11480]
MQAEYPDQPLCYWCQDETHLGLRTIRGKRLTAKGVKPICPVQWPRQAFWLYGLVSPASGAAFFYEYSHLDADCFEHFLQQFAQTFPDRLNVIQLDQAAAHRAHRIQIPDNIILLLQPPHSPELNPIERLWQDLKADLRGLNFLDLDQLRQASTEILQAMMPDWIQSLTQFPFIMRALSDAQLT